MKCLIMTIADMNDDEIFNYFSKKFPNLTDKEFKEMLSKFVKGNPIEVSKDINWTTTIQFVKDIQ